MKNRTVSPFALTAFFALLAASAEAQEPSSPDVPPSELLPGDQYEPRQLPGDQYETTQLPGDQYDLRQLPGDQYDASDLGHNQFDPAGQPGQEPVASSTAGKELLLHLPFDGSLGHSGRTGSARFVKADGTPEPTFVPGHAGQALSLSGPAAVAAPFNLDHAQYPRVTVTAWVREEAGASGSRDIFSSTSTAGVRVGIHGGRLAARLGGRGITYGHGRIPTGEWVFVAAVLDTAAGSAQLYQDDVAFLADGIDVSTSPPPLVPDPADPESSPQAWVVVGATNFETFSTTSRPLIVDDLRVYGSALGAEQVASLRDAGTQPVAGPVTVADLDSTGGGFSMQSPDSPAGAMPDGTLRNSDALPASCDSHDDCPSGSFCAAERKCHPDSHLPIGSGGAGVSLDEYRAQTSSRYADITGEREITGTTDILAGARAGVQSNDASPPDSGTTTKGPQPTGQQFINRILGKYGTQEHTFEASDGFLRYIGLGVYDGCAVKLNDDYFYPCPLAAADLELAVSLPSAHISAMRVCNGGSGELRGIEVRGDARRADGSYWNQIDQSAITQPARYMCGREEAPEFGELSRCAGDQLATGLVVHTDDRYQPVGVQLICRRIKPDDDA